MTDCFALLEDCGDRDGNSEYQNATVPPRSRLYTGYRRTLRCNSSDGPAALPQLLAEMQAALARGEHAVALFNYELGARQHGIVPFQVESTGAPLAEILLFTQCRHVNPAELDTWL